jgi:hypothetical protein
MAFSSARNSDRKRLPENLSLFEKTQFTNDLFVLSDFPVEMKPGNVGFFEPHYTRDVGLAFSLSNVILTVNACCCHW